MGSVEPCLMARWKARVEFLLSVIELLFLSLTVEALQGKVLQRWATVATVDKGRKEGGCCASFAESWGPV